MFILLDRFFATEFTEEHGVECRTDLLRIRRPSARLSVSVLRGEKTSTLIRPRTYGVENTRVFDFGFRRLSITLSCKKERAMETINPVFRHVDDYIETLFTKPDAALK